MVRTTLHSVLLVALGAAMLSCSGEPMPTERGVFVVVAGKVHVLPPVAVDNEYTEEGFAIPYFTGEPAMTIYPGEFYFILYGDYRPYDLKLFEQRGGRFEDTGQPSLASSLSTTGMAKTDMRRCNIRKSLAPGVYVLAIQQDGRQLHYAFRKGE